jgi:hypothetical protein
MTNGAEFTILAAGGRLVAEPAGDAGPALAPRDR